MKKNQFIFLYLSCNSNQNGVLLTKKDEDEDKLGRNDRHQGRCSISSRRGSLFPTASRCKLKKRWLFPILGIIFKKNLS